MDLTTLCHQLEDGVPPFSHSEIGTHLTSDDISNHQPSGCRDAVVIAWRPWPQLFPLLSLWQRSALHCCTTALRVLAVLRIFKQTRL